MKPITDVILFLFQVQMLIPDCLLFLFYFYFILFYIYFVLYSQSFVCIDIIIEIYVCSLVNLLIPLPHLCTDVMVVGMLTLVCTDVMVQGYYLFIFISEMDCNIPSQRCGRLYFPMFLFNVGLLTVMYMTSFTAPAILWSSLPIILKFSTDVKVRKIMG